jgi:hypothetical protein
MIADYIAIGLSFCVFAFVILGAGWVLAGGRKS